TVQAATAIQAVLAGNLIGLAQLAYIDVGLFEEDLSLFGVIGKGIALALAQCEEVEGCAPNVTEEELDQLIDALQARIDELDKRLVEAEQEVDRDKLVQLMDGFRQELENFEGYKEQLAEYYIEDEDEAFDDEFGEEDFARDVITNQVKTLSDILEVVKLRIAWLENLKADADTRAKLSELTGLELTIEALDEIIDATQQQVQSIESQINFLLEGIEAKVDPHHTPAEKPLFWAESGDYQMLREVAYGPWLLQSNDQAVALNERWH
ncbi:MAG: hypothetical protein IIB73_10850, partial [Proteobacteria bacterium]|nr:hypothetical protein [Pseudomonadota bacterium]